ncbi:MAG: hypothetical protein R2909_19355, partial [Gemmatimonadales bacterium]
MVRLAVDAMGGDEAPATEVEGALRAVNELPGDFVVQLVGPGERLEAELARHSDVDRRRIEVVDAPEVIGMAEKPL